MNNKLNIYIIELENNKELLNYISTRFNVIKTYNYAKLEKYIEKVIDVIIIAKVTNIERGIQIVDHALSCGKEVVCIRGTFEKKWYLSRHLSKDGAITI